MKSVKQYSNYIIPLITLYLLFLSYNPKLFKFFGNDYCQLIMVSIILIMYFKYPEISWIIGIMFLITYKSYHETQFIKEAFTQQFSLPPEKTEEDIKVDIDKELTKEESSVIQTIEKKFANSIDYLLENDVDKLQDYSCVAHEQGIGLPTPVKKYDLAKTINFDF